MGSDVTLRTWFSRPLLALAVVLAADGLLAEGPPGDLQRLSDAIAALDDDRFEVREQAAFELREWAGQPDGEVRQSLADRLHQALLRAETSFEARELIRPLLKGLPSPRLPPPQASEADLDRLAADLDDDSQAVREGAASRLEWLLADPGLVWPILSRLKSRLSDPALSARSRGSLDAAYQRARAVWMLGDPDGMSKPDVRPEQIASWIEALAASAAEQGQSPEAAHSVAERQLIDLLVWDEYVQPVRAAVEARLADKYLGEDARERLIGILDWTRPAMVAEIWQHDGNALRHVTVQYLLIGVPQQPEMAAKITHFDRIDDRTAHCVSGNTLQQGDYPVGVAMAYRGQSGQTIVFHLINLPTPRKRLWYEYHVQRDEARRLAELTEATFRSILEAKRPLTAAELQLVDMLDPPGVSRFAGPYLMSVDDDVPESAPESPFDGRTSRHALLCWGLAARGTHEAVQGIIAAIDAGRILPPGEDYPYHVPWITCLAIAHRDPSPLLSETLAKLIERTDRLSTAPAAAAELGATAAAILLSRHGELPSEFGLEAQSDQELSKVSLVGYRFRSEVDRQRVQRWWLGRNDRPLESRL